MKNVLLRAPCLTQSGYGVHSRSVAKWLLGLEKKGKIKLEIEALPWGNTPWLLDMNRNNGLIGQIMQHTQRTKQKYDVSFQLQLPNEWDHNLAQYNVGMTAAVETDRCNPQWISNCEKMSHIVVPSEHVKNTLNFTASTIQAKQNVKITVVPEPFPESFALKPNPSTFDFKTAHNYLVFGQLTSNSPDCDRKNILYTIKWFCEVFKDDPDVSLVIKTNSGKNSRMDRAVVTNILQSVLKEVRKGPFPSVNLLHGDLLDEEIHSLMSHPKIKGFITLTRGEGFGLPVLEAAVVGLPIVATNWSGHTEFLNEGKFIGVDYTMTEIPKDRVDNKIFMANSRWANPSEESFKRKIRKLHENNSIPREWAQNLKEKLLNSHNLEMINAKYDAIFGELF